MVSGLRSAARDVFVARQPIFDIHQEVHAYELLFRSGALNAFDDSDGTAATSQVLINSFVVFGLASLTCGKPAFINLTREVLLQGFLDLFPPDVVVPEILENVVPEADVVEACKHLKSQGFTLALDDFIALEGHEPLAEIADIIKVDFLLTSPQEQAELARKLLPTGVTLLAEKVETHEEFKRALSDGYTLFQGYFFSRPEIMRRKEMPGYKLHYLQLMRELHREEAEVDDIEEIIKRDVSLTYKLLRYINSAFFGLRVEVTSLRHALVLLGARNIRKWTTLVALSCMGDDKPTELLSIALSRAHFCEAAARHMGMRAESANLFLMGMLTVLDALTDKPLPELLEQIPVTAEIRAALLGEPGKFTDLLDLIRHYEKARWDEVLNLCSDLGLNQDDIPGMYMDALEWARLSLSGA
jgi:EAL and modified HD-GYP domain-containing signal transduction protein